MGSLSASQSARPSALRRFVQQGSPSLRSLAASPDRQSAVGSRRQSDHLEVQEAIHLISNIGGRRRRRHRQRHDDTRRTTARSPLESAYDGLRAVSAVNTHETLIVIEATQHLILVRTAILARIDQIHLVLSKEREIDCLACCKLKAIRNL